MLCCLLLSPRFLPILIQSCAVMLFIAYWYDWCLLSHADSGLYAAGCVPLLCPMYYCFCRCTLPAVSLASACCLSWVWSRVVLLLLSVSMPTVICWHACCSRFFMHAEFICVVLAALALLLCMLFGLFLLCAYSFNLDQSPCCMPP